ncbi:MAG: DUF4974 domain-containing protein [Chlorobi bacterium]|nr:DUF4974 domain-containing protein [Chlorobiota bacterium]
MNLNNKHIEPEPDHGDFFKKVEIPYEKSKEEVWAAISSRTEEKTQPGTIRLFALRPVLAVAAALLILIALFSVMRFYTTSIDCPAGKHLAVTLPDGSVVEMNAGSDLKYHPFWWWASRNLSFEGEGFFRVEKGSRFSVRSAMGETSVLGTTFNIYSRGEIYKVTCFTGKVKVTSLTREEVILGPDYTAEVDKSGNIIVRKEKQPETAISWRDNMFNFTAAPLEDVIKEVERQYDVSISIEPGMDLYYTGFFSKDKPVEEVLNIICKPFGITYVKTADGSYRIISNQ